MNLQLSAEGGHGCGDAWCGKLRIVRGAMLAALSGMIQTLTVPHPFD